MTAFLSRVTFPAMLRFWMMVACSYTIFDGNHRVIFTLADCITTIECDNIAKNTFFDEKSTKIQLNQQKRYNTAKKVF